MPRVHRLSNELSSLSPGGDADNGHDLSGLVRGPVQGAVDEETASRWRRELDGGPVDEPDYWTPSEVDRRLVDAIRLGERTTGRVGPKAYGSGSPVYVHEALDLWYQAEQEEAERKANAAVHNRVRLGATSTQVANADRAIRWPAIYLGDKPNERRALQLYLWCKARRLSWQKQIKTRGGVSTATAKRRKQRACEIICEGLLRDGIPMGERR